MAYLADSFGWTAVLTLASVVNCLQRGLWWLMVDATEGIVNTGGSGEGTASAGV